MPRKDATTSESPSENQEEYASENDEQNDVMFKEKHCIICNQSFSKPSNLKAHISGVHSKTKHICPHEDCSDDLTTSSSLRRHIRRKHGEDFEQLNTLISEQEYIVKDGYYVRSDGAKLAKITRLTALINQQNNEIQELEKEYSELTK